MATTAEKRRWMEMIDGGATAISVCAQFGITPPTLRKWRRRFVAAGEAGLEEPSRAPARSPNRKVFVEEAALIVGLRRAEGLGVHRLRAALKARHGLDLSVDTILKALHRAGEPTFRAGRRDPAKPTPAVAPNGSAPPFPQAGITGEIADLITTGVLRPGDKLSEAALATRLGCGRTLVREALKQLAITGLVVLQRHRGAFVAQPSLEEVQQAYAARRLIEEAIVADVARHCTVHDVRTLRQHLARQFAAHAAGHRRDLVRLLTDFHLVLASLGENRILEGMLADLTARTSLAVMVYDQGHHPSCALEEHAKIIDRLAAGDAAGAAALMRSHLTTNQGRLNPPGGHGHDGG